MILRNSDLSDGAAALVEAARQLHARGWLPATSGNLSWRLGPRSVAITASGVDKGSLSPADILEVDLEGRPLSGRRASAETRLHLAVYRRFADAGAVVHVHSPGATVLSRARTEPLIHLSGWELLKAFTGVTTHEATVSVPVLDNHQDMDVLVPALERALDGLTGRPVMGFLIRGHGLYAWGAEVKEACRHVEAFEFLFNCEIQLAATKG